MPRKATKEKKPAQTPKEKLQDKLRIVTKAISNLDAKIKRQGNVPTADDLELRQRLQDTRARIWEATCPKIA